MSNVTRPRRGQSSLSGTMGAQRKDQEQNRRQRVVIPKPKAAASAAPGAFGSTRAEASIEIGAGSTTTTAWSFGPATAYQTPGSAPALVSSTFGHFNVAASGWYSVKGHFGAGGFAGGASIFYSLNPATTSAMGDTHQMNGWVTASPDGDISIDTSTGVVYLYGDGQDPSMGGVGLLGFDVEWSGGGPAWAECWLDVTRVG